MFRATYRAHVVNFKSRVTFDSGHLPEGNFNLASGRGYAPLGHMQKRAWARLPIMTPARFLAIWPTCAYGQKRNPTNCADRSRPGPPEQPCIAQVNHTDRPCSQSLGVTRAGVALWRYARARACPGEVVLWSLGPGGLLPEFLLSSAGPLPGTKHLPGRPPTCV